MPGRGEAERGDIACAIERSLRVLGDRWTVLILREADRGVTRFAEFRDRLGIAPNVLAERLAALTRARVLERRPYREPGERARNAYHLTEAGSDARVVLAALLEWGDRHAPRAAGPSRCACEAATGEPVRLGFVTAEGRVVAPDAVQFAPAPSPAPAHPAEV